MTWNPLKRSVDFAFSVKIAIKALGLHLPLFSLSFDCPQFPMWPHMKSHAFCFSELLSWENCSSILVAVPQKGRMFFCGLNILQAAIKLLSLHQKLSKAPGCFPIYMHQQRLLSLRVIRLLSLGF